MRIDLTGRVALVTGAARGIGRAIAEALATAGAHVHLADRDAAGIQATARALNLRAHIVDLAEQKAAHRMMREVLAAEKRIDILALAAGGVGGQTGRPLEKVDAEGWHALFKANVDGAFWLAQAAAPVMREAGFGRIVTIASGAGLRPSLTGIQAYAAAKHALVGLTKQLALELGPSGITVNAVAPGFVLSNPTTKRQWLALGAEGQERLVQSTFMRRLGRPEDIAAAVTFLASDQASWISGQVLSVDGGRS